MASPDTKGVDRYGTRGRVPQYLDRGDTITSALHYLKSRVKSSCLCLLISWLFCFIKTRSRSLYAIVRPSVVCLSATFVQIFGNISTALGTLAIHW